MKTIYTINKVIFISNLVLYVTVYGGLLFQMVTGAIQVLSFLFYLFYWKRLDKSLHKHFLTYGVCMVSILSTYLFDFRLTDWFFLIPIVTSGILAFYFVYISKCQKEYYLSTQKTKNS